MSQSKKAIELTTKYATVEHKEDSTPSAGEKSGVKELYKNPIPMDAQGNPMSYEDASTAWSYWTMTFMVRGV